MIKNKYKLIVAMLTSCLVHAEGNWSLENAELKAGEQVVLYDVPSQVTIHSDEVKQGVVLEYQQDDAFFEAIYGVGKVRDIEQYSASYRKKTSSWMEPMVGTQIAELPREVQFMLVQHTEGTYSIFVPLAEGVARTSLSGSEDNTLIAISDTGDPETKTNQATSLYLIHGANPYEMMHQAALDLGELLNKPHMGTPFTRPEFNDYLGWCTWNAFYQEVSSEGVYKGLQEFIDGGVTLGFLILDDGWQEHLDRRLSGYDAIEAKFPEGLAGFTKTLKGDYGLKKLIVWQTLWGYWAGTDAEALPQAQAKLLKEYIPERLLPKKKGEYVKPEDAVLNRFYPYSLFGRGVGMPEIGPFYETYHSYLAKQGVDGVKIDAMSWSEVCGGGRGGRVKFVGEMVEAMKHSTTEIFENDSIYCSAQSNDYILQSNRNNVSRNSMDFYPDRPETHGQHIFINAHNSFWTGEFVIPDWDMFQTGHESGEFHAAARAIAGGPIYVSDKNKQHNFDVLKRLSTSSGRVPQPVSWAKPTLDSFFIDPSKQQKPIKIFNDNLYNAVVGAFNCSYVPESPLFVRGTVSPADVPGLEGELFAVYSHKDEKVVLLNKDSRLGYVLSELDYDIYTIAAVENGFAPIGLKDKYNSGATITAYQSQGKRCKISLMDGGMFVAYSEVEPKSVTLAGKPLDFHFENNTLSVQLPLGDEVAFEVAFK